MSDRVTPTDTQIENAAKAIHDCTAADWPWPCVACKDRAKAALSAPGGVLEELAEARKALVFERALPRYTLDDARDFVDLRQRVGTLESALRALVDECEGNVQDGEMPDRGLLREARRVLDAGE